MFWSRFLRMSLLVSVWAAAVFAISQSAIALFRRRRIQAQKPVETVLPASSSVPPMPKEVQSKGFRSPTLQRNALIVVVAALLLGVIGQTLFALHVPIPNVFSFGKTTPGGVTFCQCLPPSRVICTKPSSVPAQISPLCRGEPSI